MSDLASQQLNSFALLHTPISRPQKKVVGVEIEELPEKLERADALSFCEIEGDVANLVFSKERNIDDAETVVMHGKQLASLYDGERSYYITYTEQRKVQLPSLALIGNAYLWDECPKCKKVTLEANEIVKKGNLTVSREFCGSCSYVSSGNENWPLVRHSWGKDPKSLPNGVDKIESNSNYLAFYHHPWSHEVKHVFHMLKWSELEKGNFTSMGDLFKLPAKIAASDSRMEKFLVNRQDQLCALWSRGWLLLGGKPAAKLEPLVEGEWHSLFELKSAKNRYVVHGTFGKYLDYTEVIKLLDGKGKVLSSLNLKNKGDDKKKVHQVGGSTFLLLLKTLTAVTVTDDKLTVIAEKVKVFNGGAISFVANSKSDKRLGLITGPENKVASIKLKYQ